jgi:hypothetical protein
MPHLDRAASTDTGTPMVIIAILGAIALPRFWPVLPTWARVLAVVGLVALAIGGIVLAMQPTGMASRMSEGEVQELLRRHRERRDREGPDPGGSDGGPGTPTT